MTLNHVVITFAEDGNPTLYIDGERVRELPVPGTIEMWAYLTKDDAKGAFRGTID